ncbi:MAG TPA: hypothetical protein VF861_05280 [Telluria sp.]
MRLYAGRLLKAVLKRAIEFVAARPKLSFFLRRQLYRSPALANRVRSAVVRSRHASSGPSSLPDDAPLPDAAQQVLQDLQCAFEHARRSRPD